MASTIAETEQQRLASVAADYRQNGYEVKVQPAPGELPEFLANLKPDLIAIGTGESLAVEVRARSRLTEDDQAAAAIEDAVRNRPGWRFELVIDKPDPEDRRLLGTPQIGTALEEANELLQHNHPVAALLRVVSAGLRSGIW